MRSGFRLGWVAIVGFSKMLQVVGYQYLRRVGVTVAAADVAS